jgi:DNA uptake protein ComE-like DNA-binding protein
MNFLHSVRIITGLTVGIAAPITLCGEEQRSRAPGRASSAAAPEETRVDLNTADVKTLESVAVIGPEVARKIGAARPFTTIDDLDRIKGLTAEQLEQIRAKVTVSASHVPTRLGEPTTASGKPAPNVNVRKKVDLNSASLETLASTPSIGPELARAIVAARPFASIDELNRVKGLTAEQLELIRANVTVAPRAPAKKSNAARDN